MQNEDQFDEALANIKQADSLIKKHKMVKERIFKEYFFYNPVYDSLVRKRMMLYDREPDDCESVNFFTSFPSLRPLVRYKKKRKHVKKKGLLALTKVDFQL